MAPSVTMLHQLRMLARRFGIDVMRYPVGTAGDRRVRLLRHHDINVVLDVGANEGQYAMELRSLGYRGRLVSFEPLSTPFVKLAEKARSDPCWHVSRTAVGEFAGTVALNVSQNSVSSSILPMLSQHREAAPGSRYIGTEKVPINTLEAAASEYVSDGDRIFVKVDAQGYSAPILKGAGRLVERARGFELELSLIPLYEGEMLFSDGLAQLDSWGFTLVGLDPGFTDPVSGQLLQVDVVFFRDP